MTTTITSINAGLDAVVVGESTIADDLEVAELAAVKAYIVTSVAAILNELPDANSLKVKGSSRANRELELRDSLNARIK
jgi:uncharacterized membrane protein